MVSAGSNKKVFWLCSAYGHSYEAMIYNRSRGSGCPCCARQKVLCGFNDLKTTHAALASEWDHVKNENLTPEMVSAGSNKKVFWLCSAYGHSYEACINNRSNGSGCPCCKNKTETSIVEQLEKMIPNGATIRRNAKIEIDQTNYEMDIIIGYEKRQLFIEIDGPHHFVTFAYGGTCTEENFKKVIQRDFTRESYVQQHASNMPMIRVPLQSPDLKQVYHIENAPIDEITSAVKQWICNTHVQPVVYLKHPEMYNKRKML